MNVDATAAARRYLSSATNRAIFDRGTYYADLAVDGAGIDSGSAEAEAIRYLLGPQFRSLATSELDELARRWNPYASDAIKRVLDAGCGPGVTTRALAERYEGARVLGIDVEEDALALARAINRDQPRCEFRALPIEEISASEKFDLIQCRMVIEHVYDAPKAVAKLVDALRPGGIAYLEMPNYLWPWEPHVKLPMLPRSPKRLLAWQCRVAGRDADFVHHLNFGCNPISVRRWIRAADPRARIVDLMLLKVDAILSNGTEQPRVASRARTVRQLRRIPGASRLAQMVLRTLPITPSVMLLVIKS